ncbi:MAG: beta-ketoacyl-ACP synthase III [Candidatus Izemoplasmatales bacterium]
MKPRIRLVGTGRYLPPATISNADLEKMVDTSSEWIETRTGIMNRHKAVGEQTSDMAFKAALDAIAKNGYDKDRIDLIVTATITGDQQTPSTANFIQSKLGLEGRPVMAFDVNAACTGFIYALEVASNLLQSGRFHAALVIGAETLTRCVDYTDRNTCVLFGDGAGAAILEPARLTAAPAHFFTASDCDRESALTVVRDRIRMDGAKVYAFAVNAVETAIRHILKVAGMSLDDIEVVIPHQANIRIVQSVARSLDVPFHKFFMNIRETGNTSAASIIIALDEYRDIHPEARGKRALLVGFGGGFTWGSAIITL